MADDRFLFEFMTRQQAEERNKQTLDDLEPGKDREKPPEWWISVRELFVMGAGQKWDYTKQTAHRLQLSDDEHQLVQRNLDTFNEVLTRDSNILKLSTIDENLPNDSPYRKSEADVLEIFVRINREGTPLSRSDLIFSMLKLSWKESAEGLPEFVNAVNQGNSFDLDTDFVVRCLFAVSELGGRLDLDLLRNKRNVEALQTNFDKCCDAIRATVDFVQNQCKCQSSGLLGSANMLVPIVYYFFHLPKHEVPNDQVERLRTSVYLLGLAQPFSRYSEGRIGNFVRSELQPLAESSDPTFPLEATVNRVRRWENIESLVLQP
jgi:hypothetical protein